MTIEEKAKAYDEMCTRAKELHDAGNSLTKMQIEIVCPQLAESEDERIRKAIKCYVEDMPDSFGFAHGVGKSDMLAWLEKQKEEAPAVSDTEWQWDHIIFNSLVNAIMDSHPIKGSFATPDMVEDWIKRHFSK